MVTYSDPVEEKMRKYREEIHRLKQNLARIREALGCRGADTNETVEKIKKLRSLSCDLSG